MIQSPSENPYDTPKANDAVLVAEFVPLTPVHRAFRVLTWVVWTALLLSLLWDLFGMLLHGDWKPYPVSRMRLLVLALIAAVQLAMVLYMRWIVFRFMMRKTSISDWRGAVGCIVGAAVVCGMIRVLGLTGQHLWCESGRWSAYLCFAVPGFILAILFIPNRLEHYVVTRKKRPIIQ